MCNFHVSISASLLILFVMGGQLYFEILPFPGVLHVSVNFGNKTCISVLVIFKYTSCKLILNPHIYMYISRNWSPITESNSVYIQYNVETMVVYLTLFICSTSCIESNIQRKC